MNLKKKLRSAVSIILSAVLMGVLCSCAGSPSGSGGNSTSTPLAGTVNVSALSAAGSYDDIFSLLSAYEEKNAKSTNSYSTTDSAAPATQESTGAGSSNADYSRTNVQVDGIDESDIVKTDGTYIYSIEGNALVVFKADGENTTQIFDTPIGIENYDDGNDSYTYENKYPAGMYISGSQLVILSSCYSGHDYKTDSGDWESDWSRYTAVDIYDISDPSSPQLVKSLGQDGDILSSRMLNGRLYLLTSYYIYSDITQDDEYGYVPCLYDNGVSSLMRAGDILIPDGPDSMSDEAFTVVASYDIAAQSIAKTLTVLGGGTDVYMSENYLYLAGTAYDTTESEPYTDGAYSVTDYSGSSITKISKFDISNDGLQLTASVSVNGSLVNQFAMDEYNGYLRLVTTTNSYSYKIYTDPDHGWNNYEPGTDSSSNSLYILDGDLNPTGSIDGLAADETVYSVRFDKDIGYFVTFRQTDPLFAADLSDPSKPAILSSLKIPGFSEYLHVYGDGLLFGLGNDADENTGAVNDMKLTMFDTSDPKNVTEKNTMLLDARWSSALYNHKAAFISPENNIIAFSTEDEYLIFGYDPGSGFSLRANIDLGETYSEARGLYIGDYVYIVSDTAVTVLALDSMAKVTSLPVAMG